MRKCKLCEKDATRQGFCNSHYRKGMRNGTIQVVQIKREEKCTVKDCDSEHYAKGFCEKHYRQTQRKENPRKCSIDGCKEVHIAKGLCRKHYQRVVRNGSTDDPKLTKRSIRIRKCSVCGEQRKICGYEMCASCYSKQDYVRHKNKVKAYNRHVKIKNGTTGRYTKQEVLNKTNGVCGICGELIDLTLKFPHKSSFSIDHIVPISKGGSNTIDNVQPAHLLCNCLKQAK